MATVHKKQEEKPTPSAAEKKEEIIASDVIVKTTGNVEIIEETAPQEVKSEEKKPDKSLPPTDPLSDFKEKMVKEEFSVENNTSKKNYMWPILFIFIIVIVLFAGIFAYKQGIFKGEKINVTTLKPTPTITPEPTKTIDLAKYEIEILNGGGVGGEASRQKDSLTAAGFTISSIGNADNSDFTDTVIQAKAAVDKDFIAKLKTTLEGSFTSVTQEVLPDTSSVPVVVTLGTKK